MTDPKNIFLMPECDHIDTDPRCWCEDRLPCDECGAEPTRYVRGDLVENDLERLLRLIAWCRARLSKDVYRTAIDEQLANPRQPDDAKMVQS
jgi:hypothetical protein